MAATLSQGGAAQADDRRETGPELSSASHTTLDDATWLVALTLVCVAAAILVGLAPLADPDLPMHLAVGEWIVRHRSVPFVEPFAWTRAGDPYFAYSWLAQLGFYESFQLAGPTGLHVLAGAGGAGAVLAGAAVGRALKLRALPSTIMGVVNLLVAVESTPFLRPQLFMHVMVPLAWVCTASLSDDRSRHRQLAAASLLLLSAVAAGVHITFPAMATAAALPLVRAQRRSVAPVLVSLCIMVAGWLLSPYALVWLEVFRLNFAENALTVNASPVGELGPGFRVSPAAGVLLGALPLMARVERLELNERVVFGLLWLAGLVVFGAYFKGLSPWWWCSLPLAASALDRLPVPSTRRVELSFALLAAAVTLAFSVTNVRLYRALRSYEGSARDRTLPSIKAFSADPAASWLRANLSDRSHGRLLTAFSYGSYLKWRVPGLSESIDSRNIFPDSAALPDVPSLRARASTGPWRSADVAVVPITYPVAPLLDADTAWRRVGTSVASPWAPGAPRAGLWVKGSWFARNARAGASLPSRPLELR